MRCAVSHFSHRGGGNGVAEWASRENSIPLMFFQVLEYPNLCRFSVQACRESRNALERMSVCSWRDCSVSAFPDQDAPVLLKVLDKNAALHTVTNSSV